MFLSKHYGAWSKCFRINNDFLPSASFYYEIFWNYSPAHFPILAVVNCVSKYGSFEHLSKQSPYTPGSAIMTEILGGSRQHSIFASYCCIYFIQYFLYITEGILLAAFIPNYMMSTTPYIFKSSFYSSTHFLPYVKLISENILWPSFNIVFVF